MSGSDDAYAGNATEPDAWLSTLTFSFLVGVVLCVWPLTWLVRKIRKMRKGKRRGNTHQMRSVDEASKETELLNADEAPNENDTGLLCDNFESPSVNNSKVDLWFWPLTRLLHKIRKMRKAKRRGKTYQRRGTGEVSNDGLLSCDVESTPVKNAIVPLDVALPLRKANSAPEKVARRSSLRYGRRKNVVRTQLHVATDNDAETATSGETASTLSSEREEVATDEIDAIHALINGTNSDLFIVRGDGEEIHNRYTEGDDDPSTAWDLHQELLDVEDELGDDGLWGDHAWEKLPLRIRDAAIDLGYDESSWDEEDTVATSGVLWAELTTRQRRAACTMGYNKDFWDAAMRKDAKAADELEKLVSDPLASVTDDVTRGWNTFYSVIKCDKETRKICKIAIPATFETGFSTVIEALQIAIISRYLGEDALMATAMVDLAFTLTHILGYGLGGAEEVIASQAVGMKNYFQAGAVTQMSALLYIAISVPSYIFWYFFIGDCCQALGLNNNVATLTTAYIPYYGAARLIDDGLANILGNLMRIYGLNWQMAIIDTIFLCYHFVAVAFGIIYYGVDLLGMAIIKAVLALIYGFFMLGFCSCMGWLQPFRQGLLGNLSLKNSRLMKRMFKLATPVAFTELVSSGEWSLLTMFAAYMGESELSAWYIAGAIWDIFENAPEGISSAAVIRIGYHLGNARPRMAKIASYKTLLFSVIWSTILTAVFVFFSENIIDFFSQDNDVVTLLEAAVPLIGAGNIVMCVGNLAWNILTAQSRPKVPLWVNTIVGVIGTCIPLSSYWTFRKGYNTTALASAVAISYSAVSLVLLTFVFTTNWSKRCSKIISALSLSSSDDDEVSEKKTSIDDGVVEYPKSAISAGVVSQQNEGSRVFSSSEYLLHPPKTLPVTADILEEGYSEMPEESPSIKDDEIVHPSSILHKAKIAESSCVEPGMTETLENCYNEMPDESPSIKGSEIANPSPLPYLPPSESASSSEKDQVTLPGVESSSLAYLPPSESASPSEKEDQATHPAVKTLTTDKELLEMASLYSQSNAKSSHEDIIHDVIGISRYAVKTVGDDSLSISSQSRQSSVGSRSDARNKGSTTGNGTSIQGSLRRRDHKRSLLSRLGLKMGQSKKWSKLSKLSHRNLSES